MPRLLASALLAALAACAYDAPPDPNSPEVLQQQSIDDAVKEGLEGVDTSEFSVLEN